MLIKEVAHNVLRAHDTYCRRTQEDRAAVIQCKLYQMRKLLSYSQRDAISRFHFGGRRLIEQMLADVRKNA